MPLMRGADDTRYPVVQRRGLTRAHGILAEFSRVLVRATDEGQLLRDLCRILVDSGGYRMAWIGLLEHGADRAIRPVASAGDQDGYLASIKLSWGDNEFGRGPAGTAVRTRVPQTVRNIGSDPRFDQWRSEALARGYRSLGAFPLIGDEQVIGLLGVHAVEPEAFDEDELALLDELAKDIAHGILSLRTRENLRRFRLAMDNSADIIVLIDRATMRFVDVNSTACTLLGYSRDEMLAMGPQDLLPVSREALEKSYDELIADPSLAGGMKTHYRCKDGSLLPFESTRRVLRSGDTWIIAAISRDIRERIAAEEALRASNERFNIAVRATNDVIWDWDLVRDQVWWNENVSSIFGRQGGNLQGDAGSWYDEIHPEDRERVVSGIQRLLDSGGEHWSDEFRMRREDGSYAHVFDRGHVIRDGAGRALRMIGAMADITARKDAEEKLTYLAQFDAVTGLPNRYLFRDRLTQTLTLAQRNRSQVGVMFVDLDLFKAVNDSFGHSVGDKLLASVAARLKESVRGGDTVGRLSGDEFAVVLSSLSQADDAGLVAQKVVAAMARPFEIDGHQPYVTASVGIALFPGDGAEPDELIRNADAAMYRAKQQGRNGYQFYRKE